MKKWIIILICFYINIEAQINIEFINDVPESFMEKYYSTPRNYNPLQVGNVWQYYFVDFTEPFYSVTKVVNDSIINNKQYFKKLYYQTERNLNTLDYISWERNDSISGISFMLDFQDVNENGDSLDELPLDSLENPWYTRYITYQYSLPNPNYFFFIPGIKSTLVKDSNWVIIEGDTLISRNFEIGDIFWQETIIDQFGIFSFIQESPDRFCTGAIINGRKYGTIVDVKELKPQIPDIIVLENNYPNPFNPSTTIRYSIPSVETLQATAQQVTLKIYDVLGKEVATLVNKEQKAGNYSVTFNASNFASGVYYYSIMTDSKRITKPMILLK